MILIVLVSQKASLRGTSRSTAESSTISAARQRTQGTNREEIATATRERVAEN